MSQIWVLEYTGIPPDTVFNAAGGFGTPIVVDTSTQIAYYYQAGVGVQAINSPSAAGISDHGGLTGLADDDHAQYHNDTRGDARYAPIAHVGTGGTAHAVATTSVAGFLSAADKLKLDALPEWTYVKLAADLEVSSATPVVSLLAFTPAAATQYLVEGQLFMESSDITVGACPGINWPTGISLGAVELRAPYSETTQNLVNITAGTDDRVEITSMPLADTPYLALLAGSFLTGGSPSGDFVVTLSRD